MFFIVGTGRCGTLSLANTLLEQTDSVCLHEPEPSLMEEAAAYRYGARNARHIRDLLLGSRLPMLNGQTYGEASQTLSLIIPPLNDAFPDARYLWLIRNGLDVVASASGRAWYTGSGPGHRPYDQCDGLQKRWIDHRIEGDRCGEVDAVTWSRMTAFEKCCWYWQYVNHTIERDLQAQISPAHARMVTLEGLEEQIDDIVGWLGLRRLRREPVATHNRADYPKHHWNEWNAAEWAAFERWCAPLMDRFYPQWREATGRTNSASGRPADHQAPSRGSSFRRTPESRTSDTDDAGMPHCDDMETETNLPTREPVASHTVTGDTDALIREGEACFQDGDVAGARALFERAAAQDDRNPTILNNLAVCLWAAGEIAQALLHAAKGLELAPDDRNLVINGGRILRSCERTADARALYASYLADFPDDADVRQALNDLDEPHQEDTPGNTGTGDAAGDPEKHSSEGERHFSEGNMDAAEDCFRRALECSPQHIDALNNLGVVRWQRGDGPGALDFLRRALESDPEHRETVANLAVVLQGMGQHATLTALLDAYLQRHPDDGEMRALREAAGEDIGLRTASR